MPLLLEHPDYGALDAAKKLTPTQNNEVLQIHRFLTSLLDVHGLDEKEQVDKLTSKIEGKRKVAILFVYDNLGLGTLSEEERKKNTKFWFATKLVKWVCRVFILRCSF